jgi:hypothetical protein
VEEVVECYSRACYLFTRDLGNVPQVAAQITARFGNIPAGNHPAITRLVNSVYRRCEREVLTRLAELILDWMKRPMGTAWCADPRNSDPALRGQMIIPRNTPTKTQWFLDPVVNIPNPTLDVRANLDFHAWATRPAAVAWVWRDCLMVYSTWRVMMFQEPIMHALTEVQRTLLEPVFRELRNREYRQLDKLRSIHVPLRGIIGQFDYHTWPPPPHAIPGQPGVLTVPLPQFAWNVDVRSAFSRGARRIQREWLLEMDNESRPNTAVIGNNPPP